MNWSGGTTWMPDLRVVPLFSPQTLPSYPAETCRPPKQQTQRLLHFLIDHLKFFLIGCVAIAERRIGATNGGRFVHCSPGGRLYGMSIVRRRCFGTPELLLRMRLGCIQRSEPQPKARKLFLRSRYEPSQRSLRSPERPQIVNIN